MRTQCEVVGSWNAWAERIPMTKIAGTTVYEATIPMLPGKHVFKFVKDGVTWECSPDIQKEVRVMDDAFAAHASPCPPLDNNV